MTARTPEEADGLFGEYLNAGALEALVALYEPGAVLVQQDGGVAAGQAAIRASLAPLLELRPRIHMHVVRVARAGDVAALYNDWSLTATGRDGAPIALQGKAIEVVRRQADGSWKFVVDDPYARG